MLETKGEKIFNVVNIVFLSVISVICLYPLLYVLFASLSEATSFEQNARFLLWPQSFTIGAYKLVFRNIMIGIGYRNTLFYMVLGTSINLILTVLTAFILSRKQYPVKRALNLLIIFTMFFNGGLIPNFLIVKNLGLIDSIWALLLPTAVSTYNMVIMRTAFSGIPPALEESAKLDGAGDIRVLCQILIPLAMPTIAVMILFYGVSHWNSWFPAMIYIRTRTKYPLQLILREILIANSTNTMTVNLDTIDTEAVAEVVKFATIVVATVPILLIYPFLQRFFVKGVMIGAVKG